MPQAGREKEIKKAALICLYQQSRQDCKEQAWDCAALTQTAVLFAGTHQWCPLTGGQTFLQVLHSLAGFAKQVS